jgi:hypothetical protein
MIGVAGMPTTAIFFLRKRLARLVSLVDVSFEVIVTLCLILRLYVPLVCTVSLPILIAGMFIYRANGFYFVARGIEFPIFWQSLRLSRRCLVPGAFA